MRAIAIEPDVREILGRAEVEGERLTLADQLDPKVYRRVDKVIKALGGRWDQRKACHLFGRPVAEVLEEALSGGKVFKNPLAYYPTPPAVIQRMIDVAFAGGWPDAEPIHVLEPSAGEGAILEALDGWAESIGSVVAVECDLARVDKLKELDLEFTYDVVVGDFLTIADEEMYTDFGRFDLVLMNPPFATPENPIAYFDHVMRAYDLLAEGGRLVAVCPVGFTSATKPKELVAFRDFVDQDGRVEGLPDDAFAESGTGVKACIVVLEK
jgi:hypothetical protein